jgi:hypothetical protein
VVPVPPLPEPLVYVLWTLAAVVGLAGVLWGGMSWLLNRIDERFSAAIKGEEFERVVDRRVATAFDGATGPLLRAQSELAEKIAITRQAADAAHRRIDKHLEESAA